METLSSQRSTEACFWAWVYCLQNTVSMHSLCELVTLLHRLSRSSSCQLLWLGRCQALSECKIALKAMQAGWPWLVLSLSPGPAEPVFVALGWSLCPFSSEHVWVFFSTFPLPSYLSLQHHGTLCDASTKASPISSSVSFLFASLSPARESSCLQGSHHSPAGFRFWLSSIFFKGSLFFLPMRVVLLFLRPGLERLMKQHSKAGVAWLHWHVNLPLPNVHILNSAILSLEFSKKTGRETNAELSVPGYSLKDCLQ